MQDLRLISLLPSATEIVYKLGLGSALKGRSHECDFPAAAEKLPVCSRPNIPVNGSSAEIDRLVQGKAARALSIYDVDSDLIAKLNATHILTQTQCKVCAVSLEDVELALKEAPGRRPRIVSLEPHDLSDVWNDIRRVAEACAYPDRGEDLVRELQEQMRLISTKAAVAHHRPTVATVEWIDPLMVAGNWIPGLIDLAHGQSLFGRAGAHSPYADFDLLIEADPDVILVFPCGFDLERTIGEMPSLTNKPGWNELRAVRERRVFCCDGQQYFNRPGPRLVESLQILAETLHPRLFRPSLEGTGWLCYHG